MKKINFLFITVATLLFLSCGKTTDKCDEDLICYTDEPDSLFIELQLSPPPHNDSVYVEFYIGNADDGELYHSFITNNKKEYFLMPVDRRYSAKAFYRIEQDTIVTIDGDRLKVESFKNCEITCYEWEEDLVFDLKLMN